MRLRGNMVIELTDSSGQVERIEKSNMVTNAVNHILGLNPMGMFWNVGDAYDESMVWNEKLFPICPKMIGGVLLFSRALEENVENLFPGSGNLPVAYASNDVNAVGNTARGSMNLTESKVLDNGYKFVWEFTPSQGNGTIAAVGLTSAMGGANAFGSMSGSNTPFLMVRKMDIGTLNSKMQGILFRTVEMDFEGNALYSMEYSSGTVKISKYRCPVFNIGLNEKLNDSTLSLMEERVLNCVSFSFVGSYTPYGDFMDGRDGYWYGFSNEGNSYGDCEMKWIKIRKSDFSFTEGSWTLSNVMIPPIGSYTNDSYPVRVSYGVIRNGFLYVPAYNNTGIYKINLSNSADVSLIAFGFTSAMKALGGAHSCENYLLLIGDLIIGWDFQIDVNDRVVRTAGMARLEAIATPAFQYKQFLTFWGGSYGNEYHYSYLLMPYLATINNLESALVKTPDKTMKIIYTLTEENEGGNVV